MHVRNCCQAAKGFMWNEFKGLDILNSIFLSQRTFLKCLRMILKLILKDWSEDPASWTNSAFIDSMSPGLALFYPRA